MSQADIFVLLDDVQCPKGGYGNRVKIKGRKQREVWLTVPIRWSKGSKQMYNEMEVAYEQKWQARHINLLRDAYQQAPFFRHYFDDIVDILKAFYPHLASLNTELIRYLKQQLDITASLYIASDLAQDFGTGSARNLNICRHFGADTYLSGQGARAYNDESSFVSGGIRLTYHRFECPTYPQQHGAFVPNLSILDLLFNCGPDSQSILAAA
jgi:hypothetical protein